MEDMQVSNTVYDFSGNQKDWELSLRHATFQHNDACEFIFFIGSGGIKTLVEAGFSENFIAECMLARKGGYEYACFYA